MLLRIENRCISSFLVGQFFGSRSVILVLLLMETNAQSSKVPCVLSSIFKMLQKFGNFDLASQFIFKFLV